jgi:Protein of unknown function (DUF3500)
MMAHWTEFGLNHMPHFSARRESEFPPPLQALIDERAAALAEPLTGVSTDGTIRDGLFGLAATGVSTAPIADAAQAFLGALDADQRGRAVFPVDAEERRTWLNIHPYVFRHGVMLEDLPPAQRELGLDLLRTTLSYRGFGQARDIMRLNRLLADVSDSPDEFGEWPYFLSIFGDPGGGEPWAWQIDGHHLCVNCTVIGDQMVLTPTFMGSEPCHVYEGPLAGTVVFSAEERAGLDLIRSLDDAQAATAILRPSIHPDDLPHELQHPFDGRMVAGAFKDNAKIGYEGVSASDLSDAQRKLLRLLVATYAGWAREGHAEVRMREVDAHLDETFFAWMGTTSADGPFYYRVHSPVVLIEFDHHPGVVFDNLVPSRNHIHTVVRTPNAGDYGVDLLRQHHDRYDHSHGHHVARS